MDGNTKVGFCAEWHKQDYKCANCGHCKTETQLTNFYDHKMVDWDDLVCPECGFKSLKPVDALLLSDKDIEHIGKILENNKNKPSDPS